LSMMPDHALHELHVRPGQWRQRTLRRRWQRPARIAGRAGLHHNRLRRICLLRVHPMPPKHSRRQKAAQVEESGADESGIAEKCGCQLHDWYGRSIDQERG